VPAIQRLGESRPSYYPESLVEREGQGEPFRTAAQRAVAVQKMALVQLELVAAIAKVRRLAVVGSSEAR
jgi:hypothetical protein